MHRLIMLSNTYQQSTKYDAIAAKADPQNNLLWRYNRHRLEGEAIRDSMLEVSGRLNLKMGGPGVFPTVAEGCDDTRRLEKTRRIHPKGSVAAYMCLSGAIRATRCSRSLTCRTRMKAARAGTLPLRRRRRWSC